MVEEASPEVEANVEVEAEIKVDAEIEMEAEAKGEVGALVFDDEERPEGEGVVDKVASTGRLDSGLVSELSAALVDILVVASMIEDDKASLERGVIGVVELEFAEPMLVGISLRLEPGVVGFQI